MRPMSSGGTSRGLHPGSIPGHDDVGEQAQRVGHRLHVIGATCLHRIDASRVDGAFQRIDSLASVEHTPPVQIGGSGLSPLDAGDLCSAKPGRLTFSGAFEPDGATFRFGATLALSLFGEAFDASFGLGIENGEFFVELLAGELEPNVLVVPMPRPVKMLGPGNIRDIVRQYNLSSDQRRTLEQIEATLLGLARAVESQGAFAFEISNFGLRITSRNGPEASGQLRLLQLPAALEGLVKLRELKLTLGAQFLEFRSAVLVAEEFEPDVVLLDIGLPDMDGYELARRLRDSHPAVHLVALTGYDSLSHRFRSAESGLVAYLVKPVTLQELERVLCSVMHRPDAANPENGG